MPRLYLPNGETAVSDVPAVGSAKILFGDEEKPAPFKYRIQCAPCEIRWHSETVADKCWSCGEIRRDFWHP
jgi:hypothetical protein